MRRLLLTSVVLFALAACGRGEDAPNPPQPGEPQVSADEISAARFPQEYSDIPADPAVIYGELENGLRYAILQNDTPSGTAALRLRFDMGSLMEREDQRGLAHYLEHMAFNGSENVPEGEMVKILERHGLAFGADTNAYTSFGETVYMLDVPHTDDDETLDVAFMLMGELDALTLDQEAIDRERGVVLSEMRTRNSPDYRAVVQQYGFLFDGTLLADRMPIGTQEVLESADAALIRDLYESYYTPERAFFVAVGDFDPEEIEARIEETFGGWAQPAEPGGDPDMGAIAQRGAAVSFFSDPSIQTIVDVNFVKPAANRPDTIETRRQNLIRDLGNSILTRRFAALSRQPDAVFLQGSANFSEFEDTADIASVTLVAEPDKWEAALTLAENELRRAIEHGFTQAELDEQLANLRTGLRNAAEQADTRQNPALANGVAGAFSEDQVFSHPRDALARFESYEDTITVAAVEQAFAAQWDGAEPLIFVARPEPVDNAEETILAAWRNAAATEVEAPEGAEDAAFAYDDLGAPGEIAQRDVVEDLGIVRIRFANNVMLNFKQTDFERDAVRVSLRFGGGMLETPADATALQFVPSSVLPLGGTGAHSLDELQRLMAGRTVSVGFDASGDAFVARSRTTPADLETQLQLWAAYLTDPAWRAEGLTQFQQSYAVQYATMSATPGSVIQRDVGAILAAGDPRFGYASPGEVAALTPDDARAFMQDALSQSAIEIGIVGDIAEEEAVAMVARTFGALPERAAAPQDFDEARRVSFPAPTAERITLNHVGEADQAAALIYWPAPDGSDVVLARKATVLADVLRLRMIEKMREELGATYSPGVASQFSRDFPGYGYIGVRMEVRTEDVDEVFEVAEEQAAALAAGDISQDELDRAVRPILAGIDENQEQNPYWIGVVDRAQTRPEDLDRHRTQRADYEAVTLDDVKAMAAAYLDPAKAVRIQVLPSAQAAAQ